MEPVTPVEAEGRMEREMEMRMGTAAERQGVGKRLEDGRDEERLDGRGAYEKMGFEGNQRGLGGEGERQGLRGEGGRECEWVDETQREGEEDDDAPLDPLSLIKKCVPLCFVFSPVTIVAFVCLFSLRFAVHHTSCCGSGEDI